MQVYSPCEGPCVGLASKSDGSLGGRVKENIGVVIWVLRLNESVELRVLRCLLAEDRVSVSRRVGREVLCDKKKQLSTKNPEIG